jgi:PAS domain S-box-containing protein
MEQAVRILVIEDNPDDFLLIQRQLRRQGMTADCSRVDSLEDLREALEGKSWDLVLSDYSVPKLTFLRGLSLIKSLLPDLPVILVSGNVGEEQAVELLKMGVTDFILKDRLSRLAPAIQRSLKDVAELRDRRSTEIALRESNERFRMIFENSIDAIMLIQTDGRILTANPAACRVFGRDEQELCRIGRDGLVNPYDRRLHDLLEQRAKRGSYRGELSLLRKDGSCFPAEISSAVFADQSDTLKASVVIRDVTERKNLEAQLRQSQKMEDIGTLAGGIAHDFNNILTAMVNYGTLLQMDAHLETKTGEYVDNLMALIERATQLTKGLLAFSRNQVMAPRLLDLNDVIATIIRLINRLIGENISVETRLSEHPLLIMADSGQIEQMLLNLATNARDAMPSGGRLVIATSEERVEGGYWHGPDSCPPGAYALLTVSDTGVGMDQATMSRIFEPFFTTKEVGKGTGLGLSILYGIIRQHNGFVSVESTPGRGTTFSIHLPLDGTPQESISSAGLPRGGGGNCPDRGGRCLSSRGHQFRPQAVRLPGDRGA